MLSIHKLADCMLGYSKLWRPALTEADGVTQGMRTEFVAKVRLAEKFDFGRLPLEPDPDAALVNDAALIDAYKRRGWHSNGGYNLPKLSDVEIEAWKLGLVPLPAPIVWYEYTLGSSRSGFLVCDMGAQGWRIQQADIGDDENMLYAFDNVIINLSRDMTMAPDPAGNMMYLDFLHQRVHEGNAAARVVLENGLKVMAPMVVYMTLMLYSRTTQTATTALTREEKTRNEVRRRTGRLPISTHRIVTIVPREFLKGEGQGGTHASPRLHWRRSHIRHYDHRTPNSHWLAEHEHNGTKGWWVAVIPRFLVGKRELGEVTHDYFVKEGAV